MAASSLCCHLTDQHVIYQEVVVAEELLEAHVAVTYPVIWNPAAGLPSDCPSVCPSIHLTICSSICLFCTKECQIGVERKLQRESAVNMALALRRQFTVHGDVLECVEVFKYLGRLLAQDDDVQAVQ